MGDWAIGECKDIDGFEVVRLPCGCLSFEGQGHFPFGGQLCAQQPGPTWRAAEPQPW